MTSNANYEAGYRAENKAFHILEGYGYLTVRSAKSGSPFDLVGVNKTNIILVQVKACPQGKVPSFQNIIKEIKNIDAPINAKKELWIWEKRIGWHFHQL